LAEIARCLKIDKKIDDNLELILRATVEYNRSLHSVTDCRPAEVIHASSDEVNSAIRAKIDKAQQTNLDRINASRQNRVFEVGEKVLGRNNKRLGNKQTPLYSQERIEADLKTSVLIKGRVVHKDNIK